MSKNHVLCQNTDKYGISSRLQEILCLLGQGYVFEEGEEILVELLGIEISAKQIQRVSEYYGAKLEEQTLGYTEGKTQAPVLTVKDKEEPVYIMFDGSMVYTREEQWKEMKAGRIFHAGSCVPVQENRNEIMHSLYVCHLGGHKEFLKKWESYTEPYQNKICIADGAKWIWNWVEDCHPGTVQILDFFHAVEKIGAYAALQYRDKEQREEWMKQQKELLCNNEAGKIIMFLRQDRSKNKEAEKARIDAVRYYENNLNRMQYKTYLEKGYLIGSGPIESAHRNVIQQRLKLSGQRWTIAGAQQIVNLRACKKSNRWGDLLNCIKRAA